MEKNSLPGSLRGRVQTGLRWLRYAVIGGAVLAVLLLGMSIFSILSPNQTAGGAQAGMMMLALILVLALAGIAFWSLRNGQKHAQAHMQTQIKTLEAQIAEREQNIQSLNMLRQNQEREIERLRNMRINIDQCQAVLKLALLEIDTQFTDFKTKLLHEGEANGLTLNTIGEKHTYVGVLEKRLKAYIGIDLKKLQVQEQADGSLKVTGLASEFQGARDVSKSWHLRQVEVAQDKLIGGSKTMLRKDDERILTESAAQEKDFDDRLHQGLMFEQFDTALKRMGMEFVKMVLQPTGKAIVFVHDAGELSPDMATQPLLEYLHQRNLLIENQIQSLQNAARQTALLDATARKPDDAA